MIAMIKKFLAVIVMIMTAIQIRIFVCIFSVNVLQRELGGVQSYLRQIIVLIHILRMV